MKYQSRAPLYLLTHNAIWPPCCLCDAACAFNEDNLDNLFCCYAHENCPTLARFRLQLRHEPLLKRVKHHVVHGSEPDTREHALYDQRLRSIISPFPTTSS